MGFGVINLEDNQCFELLGPLSLSSLVSMNKMHKQRLHTSKSIEGYWGLYLQTLGLSNVKKNPLSPLCIPSERQLKGTMGGVMTYHNRDTAEIISAYLTTPSEKFWKHQRRLGCLLFCLCRAPVLMKAAQQAGNSCNILYHCYFPAEYGCIFYHFFWSLVQKAQDSKNNK